MISFFHQNPDIEKENLLFDARSITPKPCGVRNVAVNYLERLLDCYNVTVITHYGYPYENDSRISRIMIHRFFNRFNPISDLIISWFVLRRNFQVFFSPHASLPIISVLPRKSIFVCHDLFSVFDRTFFEKYGFLSFLASLYFRVVTEISMFRATRVIVPSEFVKKSINALWITPPKVHVIYNGIEAAKIDEDVKHQKNIIFVGNAKKYKGLDLLIAAWSNIQNNKPFSFVGWRLIIVTNDDMRTLHSWIETIENITVLSSISKEELATIRSQSAIAVVPSRREGFGLPLLESLSYGLMTIYSDIEVFRELLSELDGACVFPFCSGDISSLSEVIETVVCNYHNDASFLQEKMIAGNVVSNKFSWDCSASKLIDLLANDL